MHLFFTFRRRQRKTVFLPRVESVLSGAFDARGVPTGAWKITCPLGARII
jgi:hypothetical protein